MASNSPSPHQTTSTCCVRGRELDNFLATRSTIRISIGLRVGITAGYGIRFVFQFKCQGWANGHFKHATFQEIGIVLRPNRSRVVDPIAVLPIITPCTAWLNSPGPFNFFGACVGKLHKKLRAVVERCRFWDQNSLKIILTVNTMAYMKGQNPS